MTMRSTSAIMASNDSPCMGGDGGKWLRTSPGFTCASTGSDSTRSWYAAIQSISAYPAARNSAADM